MWKRVVVKLRQPSDADWIRLLQQLGTSQHQSTMKARAFSAASRGTYCYSRAAIRFRVIRFMWHYDERSGD